MGIHWSLYDQRPRRRRHTRRLSWRRLMNYIYPGAKVWADDMKQHEFDFDPKHLEALDASVQELLEGKDMEALIARRDKLLVDLLKRKEDTAGETQGKGSE